jgi:glucarate dehydratase
VRKDIPFFEYFAFRPEHNGAGGEMTPEAIVEYCLGILYREIGLTVAQGAPNARELVEIIRDGQDPR